MVFNPNLESAPAPEQPVYSNVNVGAEGGMAEVAGNALGVLGNLLQGASERRQTEQANASRENFLESLQSVRVLVNDGNFNQAQIAAGRAVNEYISVGGQFDTETRNAASAISGLPTENFGVSEQGMAAQAAAQRLAALMQDDAFQAYLYLERQADPNLNQMELIERAENRYNQSNAYAQIIADGALTGQLNYETEGREAIFGQLQNFTQASLGGLVDAVYNNVPTEIEDVRRVETEFTAVRMEIQRSLVNVSDDQRAEVQTQFDNITSIIENLKTTLSSDAQRENLISFVNQMVLGDLEGATSTDILGAVLASEDLTTVLIGGEMLDVQGYVAANPEITSDILNRIDLNLSQARTREITSMLPTRPDGMPNRNGLITFNDVPEDLAESIRGVDDANLASTLRVDGLLLGSVSSQDVTSPQQAERLTNSATRLGAWMLSTEGRPLSPSLINRLGLNEGLADRLNTIEALGMDDDAEAAARVYLRSGISTQISSVRNYIGRIEEVNSEAGLRWNPETEEYEITDSEFIESFARSVGLTSNLITNADGIISLNPLRPEDSSSWRGQLRQRIGRLDEAFQYRESLRLLEGSFESLRAEMPESQAVVEGSPVAAGSEPIMFIDRLAMSESSGNPQAEITIGDGRRFVGLLQFGEARLQDYRNSTGESFTQEEFRNDPELQRRVNEWHIGDIDREIDALGSAAEGYSRDGLRAVAHLGGITGMQRFVETGGEYNPSDELGTSLQDYYNRFSGESSIQTQTLPASEEPRGRVTEPSEATPVSVPDVAPMDMPVGSETPAQPAPEQPAEAAPAETTPRPAQPTQTQNEEIARSLREVAQGITTVSGEGSSVAERASDVATRVENGEQIDFEEVNRLISDALQLPPSETKDAIVNMLYRTALQMRGQ